MVKVVDTGKKTTEEERLDFVFVLTSLNTTMDYIRKPLPMDMPADKVADYYEGLMRYFKEAKMQEHQLRCKIAQEYDVPYDFIFRDGDILLQQEV